MDTINSTASVRSQLLGLQHLTMEELIEKWKMLFHKDPPQYGEVFMRRRLAHRIQELAYGGLSDAAIKKINSVNGPGFSEPTPVCASARSSSGLGTMSSTKSGCAKEGFEWNGQIYSSLSAVARMITGTNRNGFTFFGIRDKIND